MKIRKLFSLLLSTSLVCSAVNQIAAMDNPKNRKTTSIAVSNESLNLPTKRFNGIEGEVTKLCPVINHEHNKIIVSCTKKVGILEDEIHFTHILDLTNNTVKTLRTKCSCTDGTHLFSMMGSDLDTYDLIGESKNSLETNYYATFLEFFTDAFGTPLFVLASRPFLSPNYTVTLINQNTKAKIQSFSANHPDFIHQGLLVSACKQDTIHIYELKSGNIITSINATQSRGGQASAACASENLLITGHPNGGIQLWNIKTGDLIRCFQLPDKQTITALCATNNQIIIANKTGYIQIYDIKTNKITQTFKGHEKAVSALGATKDLIISGSNDKTVKIWPKNNAYAQKIYEILKNNKRTKSENDLANFYFD
ncbi:MAG: hypothetical protein JW725_04060 [Candidatus Babeliaceae bacterium]|nr:hypothetical protein [Candidatus Babeliaceae bacterium]